MSDDVAIGYIPSDKLKRVCSLFLGDVFRPDFPEPKFYRLPSLHFEQAISNRLCWDRSRDELEDAPACKQIIPYVVLSRKKEVQPSVPSIFVTIRLEGGGENRLHGKTSFGIGGHLEGGDVTYGNPVHMGLRREVAEEVIIKPYALTEDPKFVGFIYGGTELVDQVHFGLVYSWRLCPDNSCSVRETDQLVGEWVPADKAMMMRENPKTERWAKALCDSLGYIIGGWQ